MGDLTRAKGITGNNLKSCTRWERSAQCRSASSVVHLFFSVVIQPFGVLYPRILFYFNDLIYQLNDDRSNYEDTQKTGSEFGDNSMKPWT